MQEHSKGFQVLSIDSVYSEPELIEQVAQKLRAGDMVVFPTDTVYGIGLLVSEETDPASIAHVKQRPLQKNIPLLVSGPDALDELGSNVPDYARALAKHFWPGALTLVIQASDKVPKQFIAADGSIALRMPAHNLPLALLAAVDAPLATSSANLSDKPPATSVAELDTALVKEVALVVDGGKLQGTAASTVVSCLQAEPQVLRQGPLKIGEVGE